MARKTTKTPKAEPTGVKYPGVHVRFSGANGNAFNLIGLCRKAARDSDVPQSEIDAFTTEAQAGDYDNVIQTAMRWFDIH
jgi:hypothetical protein